MIELFLKYSMPEVTLSENDEDMLLLCIEKVKNPVNNSLQTVEPPHNKRTSSSS